MNDTAEKKFLIQTLGCKSNQYESQAIRESLESFGLTETQTAAEADLCIVNTCSVTGRADATCRNAVRQIRRQNPSAFLILTGCAVDLKEPWTDEIGGVDLLVPNAKKHALAALLCATTDSVLNENSLDVIPEDRFKLSITKFSERTRAFLKIQDGCDNFCTYCAIPYARGIPESRDPDAILDEAKQLIASGHREIVFTGINIGQYRRSDQYLLGDLVRDVGKLAGLLRLRMGSVEPPYVTKSFLTALAQTPTACAHLHIPLQNGDDGILQKMNRHYSTNEFKETIGRVRRALDHPAITTDVIVGFPGETETQAKNTRSFCQQVGFSRTHIFTYSPREGTPAATWKPTATSAEIKSWYHELSGVAQNSASTFAQSLIGRTETLLTEEYDGSDCVGYGERYLRIRVIGKHLPLRELTTVRIVAANDAELVAEPV